MSKYDLDLSTFSNLPASRGSSIRWEDIDLNVYARSDDGHVPLLAFNAVLDRPTNEGFDVFKIRVSSNNLYGALGVNSAFSVADSQKVFEALLLRVIFKRLINHIYHDTVFAFKSKFVWNDGNFYTVWTITCSLDDGQIVVEKQLHLKGVTFGNDPDVTCYKFSDIGPLSENTVMRDEIAKLINRAVETEKRLRIHYNDALTY